MAKVSNRVRAVWSVLITSLAAPFFAGLAAVAIRLAGSAFGVALFAGGDVPAGDFAIAAFAWSAIPATITGLALIPYVLEAGTYSWLNAAIAGVVAFGASALLVPVGAGPVMPFLAFLSGLIAIVMRLVLIRGGILKA